jgi:RNA polymerase sigma-70 factor, ECF subfamily
MPQTPDKSHAIAEAYNTLRPSLNSYLYRLTCDRQIAEDLVQDTFVKAIEKLDTFQELASFKTWLFRIATNIAIDWLRKSDRWRENAQDEARRLAESNQKYSAHLLEIARNSAHGKYEVKEHIDFCFTCISKTLPIEQQLTLMLKDIYDFPISDIVKILDKPKGTIKDWLYQARKTMSNIFERRCALINKNGVCYQCTELNGFFNPKQKVQQELLFRKGHHDKSELFKLRTRLVKSIDPLQSNGAAVQDGIMQLLRSAIHEK